MYLSRCNPAVQVSRQVLLNLLACRCSVVLRAIGLAVSVLYSKTSPGLSMTASLPVVVFFAANIIYCLAYLVTDIVWLRVLTIIAALCTFPYFIFQQQVMYSALFWQSAFMLINVLNLMLIYFMRKPVPLGEKETLVKDIVFRHFSTRETAALLKPAIWHTATAGQQLVTQGERLGKLYLLYSGKMNIIQNGATVAHRGPGSFIGEIGYMTDSSASASVLFDEDSRYVAWDVKDLRALLQKSPILRRGFESLLAINVANKLGAFQELRAA